MATVTKDDYQRDNFYVYVDAEEAAYIRDVMAAEWERRKDYGAKELADGLTRALAR